MYVCMRVYVWIKVCFSEKYPRIAPLPPRLRGFKSTPWGFFYVLRANSGGRTTPPTHVLGGFCTPGESMVLPQGVPVVFC